MSPQDFQENKARLIKELRQLARRGATVIEMVHHLDLALGGPTPPGGPGPRLPICSLFIHAFHLRLPDVNIIGAMHLFEGERGQPDQDIEASVYPHIACWLEQHPTLTEEELR